MKALFTNTFLLGICLLLLPLVVAQSDSILSFPDEKIDILESIMEPLEEGSAPATDELIEEISEWNISGKINLNEITYEQAIKIFHFTDFQYYQLQLYIETYGPLVSIYEAAAIDGFSDYDIEKIKERCRIQPPPQKLHFFKNLWRSSHSQLLMRYGQILEKQTGYDTSRSNHYEGSPSHLCWRYSFESQGKLFIKIAGEKDAGEEFFKGKQKQGFDFYAGSIQIKDFG